MARDLFTNQMYCACKIRTCHGQSQISFLSPMNSLWIMYVAANFKNSALPQNIHFLFDIWSNPWLGLRGRRKINQRYESAYSDKGIGILSLLSSELQLQKSNKMTIKQPWTKATAWNSISWSGEDISTSYRPIQQQCKEGIWSFDTNAALGKGIVYCPIWISTLMYHH